MIGPLRPTKGLLPVVSLQVADVLAFDYIGPFTPIAKSGARLPYRFSSSFFNLRSSVDKIFSNSKLCTTSSYDSVHHHMIIISASSNFSLLEISLHLTQPTLFLPCEPANISPKLATASHYLLRALPWQPKLKLLDEGSNHELFISTTLFPQARQGTCTAC